MTGLDDTGLYESKRGTVIPKKMLQRLFPKTFGLLYLLDWNDYLPSLRGYSKSNQVYFLPHYFMDSLMCSLTKALFFCIFLLCPTILFAETALLGFGEAQFRRPMQTDRPDFTEGTRSVEAGHLQLEAGYTFVKESRAGQSYTQHSLPEALLRVGVAKWTELRFFWEGYLYEDASSQTSSSKGVSDISLGIKHTMGLQDGFIPEHGIILELGVPTGSSEFTNEQVAPMAKFLWAYALSDRVDLSGNVNFDFPVEEDERYLELSNAVSIAYGVTEQLGAYLEYFAFFPDDTSVQTTTRHFANGGFTYLLNPDLQVDIRTGLGLNNAAADFFSGAGVTCRW